MAHMTSCHGEADPGFHNALRWLKSFAEFEGPWNNIWLRKVCAVKCYMYTLQRSVQFTTELSGKQPARIKGTRAIHARVLVATAAVPCLDYQTLPLG